MSQVGDEIPQPPKDPDALAAEGKWMECPDLVQLLVKVTAQSQAWWHKTHSLMQAREVHDAILGCAMLTHLPPLRLSIIRSMMYTDHGAAFSACQHPDCKLHGCEGNRLYVDSTSPLRLRMKFPHHKNEGRWKRAVIQFIVPAELAELLHMYLEGPRRTLMSRLQNTHDHVFMDLQGRPFFTLASGSFSYYWQRFLVNHGAPALNPSICRQIFVVERMSEDAAVGPSNRGAAMIMGHSVKQWHDWYDLKFHSRLAQNAVDCMQDWRLCLLGVAPAPVAAPQKPRRRAQIVLSESDSDSEQPAFACQEITATSQQEIIVVDSDIELWV